MGDFKYLPNKKKKLQPFPQTQMFSQTRKMGESREKPDAKVSEVKDKELWVILEKRQKNIK